MGSQRVAKIPGVWESDSESQYLGVCVCVSLLSVFVSVCQCVLVSGGRGEEYSVDTIH